MKQLRLFIFAFVSWAGISAAAHAADAPDLGDLIVGNPDAKVTVVEYASMTCPHCAHFHSDVYPTLKKEYVDTGKVKFIFRDFPLDGLALRASMLARCVGPERRYALYDTIYKTQSTWSRAKDPIAALKQLAALAGVSADAAEACFADKKLEETVLMGRMKAYSELKINSTPSFDVNGKVYHGMPELDDFREILDGQL